MENKKLYDLLSSIKEADDKKFKAGFWLGTIIVHIWYVFVYLYFHN